jgi:hypothetical protein
MRSVLSLDSRINICINSVISVSFHYYLLTAHPLVVVRVHDSETFSARFRGGSAIQCAIRETTQISNRVKMARHCSRTECLGVVFILDRKIRFAYILYSPAMVRTPMNGPRCDAHRNTNSRT